MLQDLTPTVAKSKAELAAMGLRESALPHWTGPLTRATQHATAAFFAEQIRRQTETAGRHYADGEREQPME
jgi:hypothetical protein